jgi:hypothetical protein
MPPVIAVPASVVIEREPPELREERVGRRQPPDDRRGRLQPAEDRGARLQPAQRETPRPQRRTVEMVNLPRTPWAVVRRLDTADNR